MSGFEVVGVILGAYPLLITALEVYKETRSGKGARRLVRNLKTEEVIFKNFIHHLLAPPVISEAELARLTDPTCPDIELWKDTALQTRLAARLGHENACVVVDILQEIDGLLSLLRNDLTPSDHGIVRISPQHAPRLRFSPLIILVVDHFTAISFKSAICETLPSAFQRPRAPDQIKGIQQ